MSNIDKIIREINAVPSRDAEIYIKSGLLERIQRDGYLAHQFTERVPVTPKKRTLKGASGFRKFF